MRYGSVCSGIEAATAAWHHMGWKPSFFSEIDAFPCAVLSHHYPDVPLHGDFTTIQENDYEPIDLLVGGTPCQSFSVAGLRKGLDDPRGNLMLGFGALAKRLSPTWLAWENVPGVLSANKGRDFGTFLGMLAELGYGFAYRVLDAQFFGVAQRRRRVFVVGYLGDWRPAAAVLFERESLSGNSAPSREAREETTGRAPFRTFAGNQQQPVASTLQTTCDDYSRSDSFNMAVHGTQDPIVGNNRAHALGRNNGAENALFVSLRGREGGATAELGGNLAGTLRAATGGGDKPHVMCFAENSRSEIRLEGGNGNRTGTLSTGGGKPGQGTPTICIQNATRGKDQNGLGIRADETSYTLDTASQHGVQSGMAVRRLTPVECERLQGFPDNFTKIPYRNKIADKCPDGPRYKALGNSMAVPVMRHIGERIQQVEQILKESKEKAA